MSDRRSPESAETLRAQADACRRLARTARSAESAAVLVRLAAEHDRLARSLDARAEESDG